MINQQLIDYIKQQLGQGISQEAITNELLVGGWQRPDVDEAFRVENINNQNNKNLVSKNQGDEEKLRKKIKSCGTWGIVLGILLVAVSLVIGILINKSITVGLILNLILSAIFITLGVIIRKEQNPIKAKELIRISFGFSIFYAIIGFVVSGGKSSPGLLLILYLWDLWSCLGYFKKFGI